MDRPDWYKLCFGHGPRLVRQPVNSYMKHIDNCFVPSPAGTLGMESKRKHYARMTETFMGDPAPAPAGGTDSLKRIWVVGLYMHKD